MRNFSSIVCQSPFPPEVPSCDPTGVSAHYVQTLQTAEYDENKELQFKMAKANRKQKLANKKINPSTSSASQCGYSKKSSKKIYSGYNNGSDQDGRVVYTRDNVTKEKGAAQASNLQENVRESYLSMMLEASGEEELSWRVLMKELKDKEQGNGNLL
ncbi:hypothetical protein L1987_06017 [Smallanthus sonchifolius]|uniref:Uncharacterized protein n=1 Tax=Smallanthus sonchifolius TaxID=185202 RepID=A0ACB9JXC6_9ASTR|nr:hypothetical protein L1987_06017 [Smallanthus sonchifolius]